eukprot:3363434-Prymnesium_polylepis.1
MSISVWIVSVLDEGITKRSVVRALRATAAFNITEVELTAEALRRRLAVDGRAITRYTCARTLTTLVLAIRRALDTTCGHFV